MSRTWSETPEDTFSHDVAHFKRLQGIPYRMLIHSLMKQIVTQNEKANTSQYLCLMYSYVGLLDCMLSEMNSSLETHFASKINVNDKL